MEWIKKNMSLDYIELDNFESFVIGNIDQYQSFIGKITDIRYYFYNLSSKQVQHIYSSIEYHNNINHQLKINDYVYTLYGLGQIININDDQICTILLIDWKLANNQVVYSYMNYQQLVQLNQAKYQIPITTSQEYKDLAYYNQHFKQQLHQLYETHWTHDIDLQIYQLYNYLLDEHRYIYESKSLNRNPSSMRYHNITDPLNVANDSLSFTYRPDANGGGEFIIHDANDAANDEANDLRISSQGIEINVADGNLQQVFSGIVSRLQSQFDGFQEYNNLVERSQAEQEAMGNRILERVNAMDNLFRIQAEDEEHISEEEEEEEEDDDDDNDDDEYSEQEDEEDFEQEDEEDFEPENEDSEQDIASANEHSDPSEYSDQVRDTLRNNISNASNTNRRNAIFYRSSSSNNNKFKTLITSDTILSLNPTNPLYIMNDQKKFNDDDQKYVHESKMYESKSSSSSSATNSSQLHAKLKSLFPLLSSIDIKLIQLRFCFLQLLNQKIADIIYLIDFSQVSNKWSLSYRLRYLSSYIFTLVKSIPFNNILKLTEHGYNHIHLELDQGKAHKALERQDDYDGSKSIFGQCYYQLHFLNPIKLRTKDKAWRVRYLGPDGVKMAGIDVGGLYRDSITAICEALQSKAVPLFIPCPNATSDMGENKEKFIPNPKCTSALHLSMYSFVGKLMGIAIRGKYPLDLDFPSVVWKILLDKTIEFKDIASINSVCFNLLHNLLNIKDQDEFQAEIFQDVYFQTATSDGRIIELKENGTKIAVNGHNYQEYIELESTYRLNEFNQQVLAIKKGLHAIIPIQFLPLYTEKELELMICGESLIDIEYLKRNTIYKLPVKANDLRCIWLFQILHEFTSKQRKLFLRFVWGRNRLPANEKDFIQKFQIWDGGKKDKLPSITYLFF